MDDRSSSAKAMAMVSSIMTIAVMMIVPALGGYFLDNWLGTVVLFMFLGVILGVVAGVWQLIKLVNSVEQVNDKTVDEKVDNAEG